MKAVGYKKSRAIDETDSLLDIEIDKPIASGNDLLVNVKAVSVNPVDTKVRRRSEPDQGYKILGWDAAGIVEAIGENVTLFKPGDEVWYAGDVNRQGSNAEYQLVDERIVSLKPSTLSFSEAAALPLTTITAWEMLFERLSISASTEKAEESILVIGAAGGVGSIFCQLAAKLTGARIIGTAGRPESMNWVKDHGADIVIDHNKDLLPQLNFHNIEYVSHIAAITRSDLHFEQMVACLKPFGKIAMIDDPGPIDISKLKQKSLSLHWEFMFTRSMFQTNDMIMQHRLLKEVSTMVDNGEIKTTLAQSFGSINAANLKRAHTLIESGTSRGKIVLEGFD